MMCLSVVSCSDKGSASSLDEANVLLYWPTDETDPSFKLAEEIARKELHRQGIRGEVTVHCSHSTERYETSERPLFNELILRLRAEGRMPDLILSYGDANRWLLKTNSNSVTASIPTVCYGLNFQDYLPYQNDLLENNYNGGRSTDMVDIVSCLHLEENLIFADTLCPKLIEKLQRSEYLPMYPKRYVTLLDVENLWTDKIRFQDLLGQMESLPEDKYYNNLIPKVDEQTIRRMAHDHKKIVFSCRSLMAPTWNASLKANQTATTWAFFPQKSSNFYIQSKHDNKTRNLVNGPSFMPYFTMVPEDFLINSLCIGGYFPTLEDQIRDAVSAGVRLLKGDSPSQIGSLSHSPSYNLNWDAVRFLGLEVNSVPENVNLYNVTLKDRNPRLYSTLKWIIWILFSGIMIWSIIIISILTIRARRNKTKLREYADLSIRNGIILNRMMEVIDFKVWERIEGAPEQIERVSTDAFFAAKIREFVKINTPGNYSLQIYGSIDNHSPHWYDIKMTVSQGENNQIEKRGVIVNNDIQKELEAIEAEANRIITSVKTREGFIASMNHEIRTPLNSIIGYTQILSMPDLPLEKEELEEYSSAIESNSLLLQNTIKNILTAAQISKALVVAHKDAFLLDAIVSEISDRATKLSSDDFGRGRLVLNPSEPNMIVRADRKLLCRVLENLIINASVFSDKSSPIEIGWGKSDRANYSTEIWVKDSGIGIDDKYKELVFERFFKVDSFSSGCGLGLFICKTYVGLMGGEINVESNQGGGSKFIIKLP